MIRNGVRHIHIRDELRVKDCKQVRETISGGRNDRRVLAWLREHGCPVKLLALPLDMRGEA